MSPLEAIALLGEGSSRGDSADLLRGIHWLGHAGLLLEGSRTVYIDPFNLRAGLPKADLVLITHPHYDHCSPRDVARILKKETVIMAPEDALAKMPPGPGERIVAAPGKTACWGGLQIAALPAYSTTKPQHPKSKRWVGYMLRWEGRWIYHAGDGGAVPDCIPPRWLDAAFFPVDPVYNVEWSMTTAAARALRPGVSVPIHFGSVCGLSADAVRFIRECRESKLWACMPPGMEAEGS